MLSPIIEVLIMRELTIKQKNLLKKWYKEKEPSKEGKMLFGNTNTLRCAEDLTSEQWEILEEINDTEVLYQNVNCFLNDLRMND